MARAVRRGLANVKIQAYLTAAAVNLKRLAAAVAALLLMLLPIHRQSRSEIAPELTGHGLPLSKCEAYNRVYDQFYQSR
jgi:hypothetical protein